MLEGMGVAPDAAAETMMELVCGTFAGPEGPSGNDMDKTMCNSLIYAILANDDPHEYPLVQDGPLAKPISKYSSIVPGYCDFDYTMKTCYTINRPETCTESELSTYGMIQACDCSDPENYNFADKGRFKI